jgi:putative protein-disulfide isomerase
MSKAILRYIYDPLCGWCYGASPLVEAARAMPGLAITLHGGGLMTGANRRPVTPALRGFIMQHDKRIAALTDLPFGEAYFDGLLRDSAVTLDSQPPIAAILAAETLQGRGLDLLARLQSAHYVEGLRISEAKTLAELAAGIGLDPAGFQAAFETALGQSGQAHIEESRKLLAQADGEGFPTFILETQGGLERLNHASYYGKPGLWPSYLESRLGQ